MVLRLNFYLYLSSNFIGILEIKGLRIDNGYEEKGRVVSLWVGCLLFLESEWWVSRLKFFLNFFEYFSWFLGVRVFFCEREKRMIVLEGNLLSKSEWFRMKFRLKVILNYWKECLNIIWKEEVF